MQQAGIGIKISLCAARQKFLFHAIVCMTIRQCTTRNLLPEGAECVSIHAPHMRAWDGSWMRESLAQGVRVGVSVNSKSNLVKGLVHVPQTSILPGSLVQTIMQPSGADPGGVMRGRWPPPFQGWISCTSLLCLAKQPTLPPSLQLMNLDLTQNIAKNLFVQWKSRAPLTSRAVCLVHGNDVGVVYTKVGVAEIRAHFARDYLVYDPPNLMSWILPWAM